MSNPFKSDAERKAAFAHMDGVDKVGQQKHWFEARPDDPYVYHGTDKEHLSGIKEGGLQAFLHVYHATDPKVAMNYAYRPNLHHPAEGRTRPGVLLRVKKDDADPKGFYKRTGPYGVRQDFWTGPDVAPEKIQMREQGKWKNLKD